jgi:hypothetical protein
MSRFWLPVLAMIALDGNGTIASSFRAVTHQASAPSLPAIAQFPTVETLSPTPVDSTFPEPIGAAVLQAATVQSGLPVDQLTITKANAKTWSDGCLGLAPPDRMCTAILVRGWEVTVTHQRQEWVYRTSGTGEKIVWDPAGTRLSQLIVPAADRISLDRRPPKMERSVVFREIKSGGFAGITEELRLYKDGRLVKHSPLKTPKPADGTLIRIIPKPKVRAFQQLLISRHFGQFDGLRYPAPRGAADFFSYTLGNWQTTVEYADIGKELPTDLEQVIRAWRSLISP